MGSNPTDSAINFVISPTVEETELRRAVMSEVLRYIREGLIIKLPPFDPAVSRPSEDFALVSVGLEPNPFSGLVGEFRYQFEGEEDLLHLIVTRSDNGELTPEDGRSVGSFLFQGVPPALLWMRPGTCSIHLYCGHDELLTSLLI